MIIRFGLGVVAAFGLMSVTASALPLSHSRSALSQSYLIEGEEELSPLSFIKFCMQHARECDPAKVDEPAVLDLADVGLLEQVNRDVNSRIRPRVKPAVLGTWEIDPSSGDCNDFAVTKRHDLIALGFPGSALRLAVVVTGWGEGHLVLVARTETGDLLLDNLTSALRSPAQSGYRFLKVQSAGDATSWMSAAVSSANRPTPSRAAPTRQGETWFVANRDGFVTDGMSGTRMRGSL